MIIYKITNLMNGLIYVGFDSKNRPIEKYAGSSKNLKIDILVFGIENFQKEVLEFLNSNLTKKQIEDKENYWINLLNSRNPLIGYNIAKAGKTFMLGCHHTEESKQKMKNYKHMLGKKHSEKTKQLMSEKAKGINNSMYGKKQTKEHIEKRAQKMIGRHHSEKTKKILSELKNGIKNPNYGKDMSGSKNGMYGKNLRDIWIEKHGLEKAENMWIEHKKKISEAAKNRKIKI